MSRIGKALIDIPKGVTTTYKDNLLVVKGPKGELKQQIAEGFDLKLEGATMQVVRPNDEKQNRALHGLYRALIQNMAVGVSEGYTLTLELVGVGYKADMKGTALELSLGFSHQIFFAPPKEVSIEAINEKGKNPRIVLKGHDKQLIGQVAAKIRSIRPPEPYKGKGVRFEGEVVRRKVGKASGKGKK